MHHAYTIERDAGVLCRILGLYASRGLDVVRADYADAAHGVMTLEVCIAFQDADTADVLRVLIAKAAGLVGVLKAGGAEALARGCAFAAARRRE